ncbi:HNH endonuclease [Streptosporangium sp. NPDC051023]|uniref:HNH endonuclease n=1 Tax=Streptosporangium sp. NPDC051023 TaxID=3155410 RepID=UPI0034508A99
MSERICSVPACPEPVKSRGWCSTHYRRWQRTGDVGNAETGPRVRKPCAVKGCDSLSRANGFCTMHLKRWKKTGDPGPAETIRIRRICTVPRCERPAVGGGHCLMHYKRARRSGDAEGLTLERRFFDHIAGEDDRGCWLWDKPHPDSGYGQFAGGTAHRWSYEFFRTDIPDGLDIDHLCRNRACVNPWHFDPVPTAVNVLRGEGPSAINARKTHCIRGHAFTVANTYVPPKRPRSRGCRACRRLQAAKRRKNNSSTRSDYFE